MAALTITAANVLAGLNASIEYGKLAGEAITRGEWVRVDSSTNEVMLAANTSEANANVAGVALNDASDGQPIAYAKGGDNLQTGASGMSVPGTYYLGGAGEAVPVGDLESGDWVTTLFVAKSGTVGAIAIKATGAQMG